jgi:hypothetical protein
MSAWAVNNTYRLHLLSLVEKSVGLSQWSMLIGML